MRKNSIQFQPGLSLQDFMMQFSVPAVAISKTNEFGVEYETLGFQYDLIDSLVDTSLLTP